MSTQTSFVDPAGDILRPLSKPTRKRFSVLLLYPDYMSDGGSETFYRFVLAYDVDDAIKRAQRAAVKANNMETDQADDFASLLVLSGHAKAIG